MNGHSNYQSFMSPIQRMKPSSFFAPASEGQRLIGFARHATIERVNMQVEAIRRYAAKVGATLVDVVVQTGGPSRIDRKILADLVQRKRDRHDFDAIIVTDASRMSRHGASDALSIVYLLSLENIALVSCDSAACKPLVHRVTGHK